MPRGRTASDMTLQERREKASEYFGKGFNVSWVARKLSVTWDTAKSYQRWHEEQLAEKARENPQLLQDTLRNTIAAIAELDQVRAAAWTTYHTSESSQIKLQALNTIRQASQDKAKLFGVFGVKQDFYVHVQNVTVVQRMLVEWLQRNLCPNDRAALEAFLTSEDVARFMSNAADLPMLEMGEEETEEVEVPA